MNSFLGRETNERRRYYLWPMYLEKNFSYSFFEFENTIFISDRNYASRNAPVWRFLLLKVKETAIIFIWYVIGAQNGSLANFRATKRTHTNQRDKHILDTLDLRDTAGRIDPIERYETLQETIALDQISHLLREKDSE